MAVRITPIEGRFSSKPGKFLVRSVMAVRELSDSQLKKITGFIRKTTEGLVFDNKSNAQNFVKSDVLKDVRSSAIKSRSESSGIARQKKSANPKLFNKIIKLAEEGKTSVGKIGTDSEVIKLNNGKKITYASIKNIITREKGKEFFNKVAETKQFAKGENRILLEKNVNNLMKDYYKGMGSPTLTKKYLPNSPNAKKGTSATVLTDVIKENIDSKKLANRPAAMGSNQYGTRKEQIKVLKNLQNYLSKNTNKFTSKAAAESNLKNLFKGSDSGTIGNFVARTNILRKAYNSKNLPEGFKVNQKVKDLIKYLPAQDFVESELRALGFSEKTIKSMNQVETAVQKMTTASTQLEHALPRSVIRALNLPKKYYLTGERTTNFLNKFKMQFDGQMKNAAMTYAQSNQTPSDYKKYITNVNKIRDKVKKLTGGYEIGYVDFDKAGNAIPKTNQMSFLRKGDAESIKAKGIENFKKNIKYHNALKKNFDKNPTSLDFFTLRDEISESPRKFVNEKINSNVNEFIKKVKSVPGGCRAVITRALGGPLDTCEAIIKADPEKAAAKLTNAITATKGPLKDLKQDSQKLIRLFRGIEPNAQTQLYKASKNYPAMYDESLKGRFFFDNARDARYYARRQGSNTGRVLSVDVPENFVNIGKKMSERRKGPRLGNEIILPKKFVGKESLNIIETARARGEALTSKITFDNIKGAFINRSTGDSVSSGALKAFAEETPIPVQAGTEDAFKPIKKNFLKTVGKTLAKVGAPLPTALLDGYFIGKQIQDDKPAVEIAKDPLNWLGLATMSTLTKVGGVTGSGTANSILRLGMNPGLIRGISRFAGLPGLAISTALTAYDQYDKYKNEEGLIYNLFNQKDKVL